MDLHDIYSIYESFKFLEETVFDFSEAYRKNVFLFFVLSVIFGFIVSDFFQKAQK